MRAIESRWREIKTEEEKRKKLLTGKESPAEKRRMTRAVIKGVECPRAPNTKLMKRFRDAARKISTESQNTESNTTEITTAILGEVRTMMKMERLKTTSIMTNISTMKKFSEEALNTPLTSPRMRLMWRGLGREAAASLPTRDAGMSMEVWLSRIYAAKPSLQRRQAALKTLFASLTRLATADEVRHGGILMKGRPPLTLPCWTPQGPILLQVPQNPEFEWIFWLRNSKSEGTTLSTPQVCSRDFKEIDPEAIQYIRSLKRGDTIITKDEAAALVKIMKGRARACRRGSATTALAQGMNITDIQRAMGHKNVTTTYAYLDGSLE